MLSCELGAGVVCAFEPQPPVRELLARNASLQSKTDIEVVAAACSDHDGRMPLYLADPRNTGASSLMPRSEDFIEVDVLTLDGYAKRTNANPDLLKIDVEGHEREVLVGARTLLQTARPVVIAEVGAVRRDDVVELMRSLDYEPHSILPDGSLGVHGPKVRSGPENICFRPQH